jgi:putative transposase
LVEQKNTVAYGEQPKPKEDTLMDKDTVNLPGKPEESILKHPLHEIARQGARELIKKALEIEINSFIEKYQYLMNDDGDRMVVRNGYNNTRKIVTGAGQLEVATPRVDDRVLKKHDEPRFKSTLIPRYLRRAANVNELIPVLYLKGISTGDFTEALEALLGKDAIGLSAENIVRLKKVWEKEYYMWQKRDLSGKQYVYMWVDGIYFNVRLDGDRQCILVIIGAKPNGVKEVISVTDGFRESKESYRDVLRDLKHRGLKIAPKLAIGDGSLGFWAAIDEEYPETRHQICWVHKTGNVLDKLPESLQHRAKTMIHNIYLAPSKKDANIAFDRFIETFSLKYPKAVKALTQNRDKLLTFYDYPAEHWLHIRSTNVIESPFATVRLRTNKTKGCGTKLATLTMVYKLLMSAQKRWWRLRGHLKVEDVMNSVQFKDGVEVSSEQEVKVKA